MDRLEEMYALQKAFNESVIKTRRLEHITKQEWLQKHTLALMCETAEMLEETNYKWWKNPQPVDQDALKEELVDMFHFFLSLCINADMDPGELHARYLKKNQVNFGRQTGEVEKPGYKLADS
ncbi:MAG: dUTPase [Clostridiales bacterium]|nr:dUTPase [Clostridiales bacterium]